MKKSVKIGIIAALSTFSFFLGGLLLLLLNTS